jgi:uroporphyrin-III C-methyltransferase/precorrin-2 dehydrogenase/sirohydrochlorin ferrochelatase
MQHLPLFLDIRNRLCVVIGGGAVAVRKVRLLRRAEARVRVVAPELDPALAHMAANGELEHVSRCFCESDLDESTLVVAATNRAAVNRAVAAAAKQRNLPVNVIDAPEIGNYIVPSIVNREPIIAAVSTGGASPVVARLVRARLESLIPAGYGRLAELAASFRERVKAQIKDGAARKRFWYRVLQGGVAERVFAGQMAAAEELFERELEHPQANALGEVYLVGAGPGDPDLLTLRAVRLMQQADVVVYDRLVAKPILDMTSQEAERIYVGKQRDNHAMRQEEINQLLAELAKSGRRVVRLKGGDPFIFGRGGEEIDTLAAQGVPFQVVPGVTAAAGCAAYSGIPLTHRDHAQSVTFVTGHLKDGTINLNWVQLAQPNQTVVFYMGLNGLPVICRQLQAHGVPPSMPAALVQQGTTHKQRVFIGTVGTLPDIVARERPKPPTLIIVGEVVQLHDKLSWYDALAGSEQGATSPIEPGAVFQSHASADC